MWSVQIEEPANSTKLLKKMEMTRISICGKEGKNGVEIRGNRESGRKEGDLLLR